MKNEIYYWVRGKRFCLKANQFIATTSVGIGWMTSDSIRMNLWLNKEHTGEQKLPPLSVHPDPKIVRELIEACWNMYANRTVRLLGTVSKCGSIRFKQLDYCVTDPE